MAIVSAGAIGPLVALVRGGSAVARKQAAWSLGKLAHKAENKMKIIQAGAIEPLEALARDGGVLAAWALTRLAAYPSLDVFLRSIDGYQSPSSFAVAIVLWIICVVVSSWLLLSSSTTKTCPLQ